jgi:hypothetical protein
VIERARVVIERIWTGRRAVVIAVGAIAALAIVATTLLVVVGPLRSSPGSTASPLASRTASATPSALPSPSPTDTPNLSPTPVPWDWVYADLDGMLASPDTAHRLPMAIMVDDNTVARPQSGISSASIVYQAPADGGEDRYMYVYQEGTANGIGPVRSARPYYVYWAAEYKALYGHWGGDAKSLRQVIPTMIGSIYNMDDLSGGSCAYQRDNTRDPPHNGYTSSAALISCAAIMRYPSTYQKLPTRTFRDDVPLASRPGAQVISIGYRTGTVGYQYDPTTDSYLRLINGTPEIDQANGSKVHARTIVVMYQSVTIDPESEPGYNRPVVHNVGSDKATVFLEGQAITATWKKTSNTALTRFYDSSGKEIPFVRGEIFMQSVPPGTSVTVG